VRATRQQGTMIRHSDHFTPEHSPVMPREAIDLLNCRPGGIYVDATLGLGGHAHRILARILPGGLLIGIDRDEDSLEKARVRLKSYENSVRLFHDNFKNLPLILNNLSIKPIDGILLDLGVSSYQLLSADRGFSFQGDSLLDMRMDRRQRWTAADLVNNLPEDQLADIIYQYGEERLSRKIAAAIVAARAQSPVTRCAQLAQIVTRTLRVRGFPSLHPATKTFQALRIAVNQELEGLEDFLIEMRSFLKTGARMVVISFHSLEDRIIKRAFRRLAGQCICERPPELCTCARQPMAAILTTKPLKPGADELAANPRSRSARLRALEVL
jgi:16S rRNA (cytosine1402-N4)-methyltransferase